jgi:nicotinic acetylcholine receptor, invertebrate
MSPLVKRLFLGFMPRVLMMRRTKYTLPEYDDSIHTTEMDIRDHYREMNADYANEYKDNNGHQDYENMPPVHHHGKIYRCRVM